MIGVKRNAGRKCLLEGCMGEQNFVGTMRKSSWELGCYGMVAKMRGRWQLTTRPSVFIHHSRWSMRPAPGAGATSFVCGYDATLGIPIVESRDESGATAPAIPRLRGSSRRAHHCLPLLFIIIFHFQSWIELNWLHSCHFYIISRARWVLLAWHSYTVRLGSTQDTLSFNTERQAKIRSLIDHNGWETKRTSCSIRKYWVLIEIWHHQDVMDFDVIRPQIGGRTGRTENIVWNLNLARKSETRCEILTGMVVKWFWRER